MVHLYMNAQTQLLPGRQIVSDPDQLEQDQAVGRWLDRMSLRQGNRPPLHPDTSQIPDRSQLPRTGASRRRVGLPLRPRLSQLYLQEERRLFPYARRRETDGKRRPVIQLPEAQW